MRSIQVKASDNLGKCLKQCRKCVEFTSQCHDDLLNSLSWDYNNFIGFHTTITIFCSMQVQLQ